MSEPPCPTISPENHRQSVWRRNGRAAGVVTGITLAALVCVLVHLGRTDGQALLLAARVELLLLAVLTPLACYRADGPMDALFRAGPGTDAFGLAMLILAAVAKDLHFWPVLAVYLLLAAVLMIAVGVFLAVRSAGTSEGVAALTSAAAVLMVSVGVVADLPARLDIDRALQDAAGLTPCSPPWTVALAILVTLAGLVWTGEFLIRHHRQAPDV